MRLWCDFGGLTPKNADATQEKLIFRPMRDLFAGPIIWVQKSCRRCLSTSIKLPKYPENGDRTSKFKRVPHKSPSGNNWWG